MLMLISVVLSFRGLTGPLIRTLLASRTRRYGASGFEVTGDSSIGLKARAIVRPIRSAYLSLGYWFDSIHNTTDLLTHNQFCT